MVLYLSLIAAIAQTSAQGAEDYGKVSIPSAKAVYYKFLDYALENHVDNSLHPLSLSKQEPRIRVHRDTVSLFGLYVRVHFQKSTGEPIGLSISPHVYHEDGKTLAPADKLLSLEECQRKALDLYHAFGGKGQLSFNFTNLFQQRYTLQAVVEIDGKRLEGYDRYFEIDGLRGQPVVMRMGPTPPTRFTNGPAVPYATARDKALLAYRRHNPYAVAKLENLGSVTWMVPKFGGMATELRAEHQELAKSDTAMPIYKVILWDAQSKLKDGGYGQWQMIYIDARDGHVLAIASAMLLGATASHDPSAELEGTFQVAADANGAAGSVSVIELNGEGDEAGAPVLLMRDDLVVAGHARGDVLSVKLGEKKLGLKLGKPLQEAIGRMKPQSRPFGG